MMNPEENSQQFQDLASTMSRSSQQLDNILEEIKRSKKETRESFDSIGLMLDEVLKLLKDGTKISSTPKSPEEDTSDDSRRNSQVAEPSSTIQESIQEESEKEKTREAQKIIVPIFEGIDAFDWFNTVESLFDRGNYTDEEKLDMVSMSLTGRALRWHKWEVRHVPYSSWVEFKRRVLIRFGSFTGLTSNTAQEQEPSTQEELSSQMKLIHEKEREVKQSIEAKLILDTCSIQEKKSGEATDLILSTDLFPQMKLPHLQVPSTSLESSHQDDSLGDYRMKWEAVIRKYVVKNIENSIFDDVHGILSIIREELPNAQGVAEEFQSWYNSEIKSCDYQVFDRMILKEQSLRKRKCFKSRKFKFKTRLQRGTIIDKELLFRERFLVVVAVQQAESKFQMKHKFSSFAFQDKLHFSKGSIIDKYKAKTQGRNMIESHHLTFKSKLGQGSKYVWVSFCSIWHRWRVKQHHLLFHSLRTSYSRKWGYDRCVQKGNSVLMMLLQVHIQGGQTRHVCNDLMMRLQVHTQGGQTRHVCTKQAAQTNGDAGLKIMLSPLVIIAVHFPYFSSLRSSFMLGKGLMRYGRMGRREEARGCNKEWFKKLVFLHKSFQVVGKDKTEEHRAKRNKSCHDGAEFESFQLEDKLILGRAVLISMRS